MKLFCDLGEGTTLPCRQIVMVISAESATKSAVTRAFLKACTEKGCAQAPKTPLFSVNSLVLTNIRGQDLLYSSAKSPALIAKNMDGDKPHLFSERS